MTTRTCACSRTQVWSSHGGPGIPRPIEEDNGFTRPTVTHELEGAPLTAEPLTREGRLHEAAGGWRWILSSLKTLLETGQGF